MCLTIDILQLVKDSSYTLSVLFIEYNSKLVKHYKIVNKSNKQFYLNRSRKFKSLDDLIDFYSRTQIIIDYKMSYSSLLFSCNNLGESKGLCSPLLTPCEKLTKRSREDIEIDANQILIEKSSDKSIFNGTLVEKYYKIDQKLVDFNFFSIGLLKGSIRVVIKFAKYSMADKLLNEIELMREIEHKHIIKLLGTCVCYSNNVFVCMENMASRDLKSYLIDQEWKRIEKRTLLGISGQLCSALLYLARKYIIHRDLACKNVFIGHRHFVKLGNFGFARHLDLNNQYIIKSNINEGLF